jgi:hypothetical protein
MNPDTPARLPLDDITVPTRNGPLPTDPTRWLPRLSHADTSPMAGHHDASRVLTHVSTEAMVVP